VGADSATRAAAADQLEGFVDERRVAVKVLDVSAPPDPRPVELRLLVANALDYMYNLVPRHSSRCAPSLSPPSVVID